MGSLIAHRIDYNGVAALRGQQHMTSKNKPKYPAATQTRHHRLMACDRLLQHFTIKKLRYLQQKDFFRGWLMD